MGAFERGHLRCVCLRGMLVLRLQCKNRTLVPMQVLHSEALLRVGTALSLPLPPLSLPAQFPTASEYRAKGNYLANFPSFVDWPPETLPAGKGSFLVCVFGEFSFGTTLAEITRGTAVLGRRIEIRWMRKPRELSACQILFVSHSEQKRYNQALDAVSGRMVVTGGEKPGFQKAGGVFRVFGPHRNGYIYLGIVV